MIVIQLRLACLILLATCLVPGCGAGDWGSVSGTVTLDGAPLGAGVITFHPVAGGADAYGQVTQGKFTIFTGEQAGAQTGSYRVTVSATTIPESGSGERAKLLTPEKYATPATSDLKAEVAPGANLFSFELSGT